MAGVVTLCVITLTVAGVPCGSAEAAIIRLKSEAAVTSSVVTLADVADVFDRDPETVRKLREVTLLPAPPAGSDLQVDFATIRSRLLARGFNLAALEFSGASRVTVSDGGSRTRSGIGDRSSRSPASSITDFDAARAERLLATAVRNYLRTAELGQVSVEVGLDRSLVPLVLSGQASGYEVRGGQPPWDAWQIFWIRLIDRDDQLQTLQVRCRVVEHPFVPTVKYTLPRGHVIRREDVVLMQLTEPDSQSPARSERQPSLQEVLGRETTRSIRQGQPVSAADIRQIPLIRRGDIVTAFARVGGITVKRQLKARDDGAMDERVLLVSLDGRQQLEATVSGYHEANVLAAAATPAGAAPDAYRRAPNAMRSAGPDQPSVGAHAAVNDGRASASVPQGTARRVVRSVRDTSGIPSTMPRDPRYLPNRPVARPPVELQEIRQAAYEVIPNRPATVAPMNQPAFRRMRGYRR